MTRPIFKKFLTREFDFGFAEKKYLCFYEKKICRCLKYGICIISLKKISQLALYIPFSMP